MRSPELSRALEQQRFAVNLVRSLADPAPSSLRAWLRQYVRRAG